MSNFRVVVHLHSFFSDVRSSSRVYITSEMKTVEHLKAHISELFDLTGSFYLVSNNFYLPDSEDVRILKEDDIVVAIRENVSYQKVRNKHKVKQNYDEPECESELPKKKSIISCVNYFGGSDNEFASIPLKKKKKQKHKSREPEEKHKEDHAKIPKYDNMDVDGEIDKSSSRNVKLVIKLNNCYQDTTEDMGKYEVKKDYENVSKKDNSEVSNDDLYSLWHYKDANAPFHTISESRLQKPIVASKKEVKPMKISTEPKLIKSIIVASSQSSVALESENIKQENISIKDAYENGSSKYDNTNNTKSNGMEVSNSSCELSNSTLEQNENKELKNNTPCLFQNQWPLLNVNSDPQKRSLTSTTNLFHSTPLQFVAQFKNSAINGSENRLPPTTDFSLSQCNTQSKNTSVNGSENRLSPTTNFSLSQCNTQSKNRSINGSENNDEEEYTDETENTLTEESSKSSLPVKRKRKRVRRRKPKFVEQESVHEAPLPTPIFTTAASAVHIRFDNVHKQTDHVEPESSLHSEADDIEVNYEKLIKEEICKFPIMTEIFPKKGDVIAFKICKLSTAYTPEISEFIIAKVIEYRSASKNTLLKILEGIDNFTVPEGKFFMDDFNNQNEKGEKQICWNELLEPRLLFP